MSARLAIALVVALGALVGVAAIVARHNADSEVGRLTLAPTTPAAAPFAAFNEARVALDSKCLRLLVATTPAQRSQGFREVTSFAPYDGMLFVYPHDTNTRFTMAQTPTPLEITWFDARGKPVDHTAMTPCPAGTDASCPTYASKRAYRYALERTAGSSGSGSLASCA